MNAAQQKIFDALDPSMIIEWLKLGDISAVELDLLSEYELRTINKVIESNCNITEQYRFFIFVDLQDKTKRYAVTVNDNLGLYYFYYKLDERCGVIIELGEMMNYDLVYPILLDIVN